MVVYGFVLELALPVYDATTQNKGFVIKFLQ
jgi:hypothetical protein